MKRQKKSDAEYINILNVEDIYSWYQLTNKGLLEQRDEVIDSVIHKNADSGPTDIEFLGMSLSEIREMFTTLKDELEIAYILKLTAAGEAAFKVDFNNRVKKGKKRRNLTIEDAFKKISTRKSYDQISLEHDIIGTWKLFLPEIRRFPISYFKGLLKYRHWIAHGRYWPYKGQQYSLDETNLIISGALEECGI